MSLRNLKRQRAVDFHGGDTRLLPWPIEPENSFSQAYTGYVSLPDGTECINYRNGQPAVLFQRQSPGSPVSACIYKPLLTRNTKTNTKISCKIRFDGMHSPYTNLARVSGFLVRFCIPRNGICTEPARFCTPCQLENPSV